MSNTSTGTSTMSAAKTSAKRVAKKEEVAAPAVVATPAVAAAAPAKKEKKAVAAAAPVVAAAAVAPAAAPVASAVSAPVEATVPATTVAQDIESVMSAFQAIRDNASKQIKALQALQKRVARDMKEAGRRRRHRRVVEGGEQKEKRPTIFTTPVTLKDELAHFLGKSKGAQMTPAEVSKAIKVYIDSHKLKNEEKGQGHTIYPDVAMRKALGIKEGESVTYRNIQSYLYKLYVLPEKKVKA
jgi:hypothetical protein